MKWEILQRKMQRSDIQALIQRESEYQGIPRGVNSTLPLREAIIQVLQSPPPTWEELFQQAQPEILHAISRIEDEQLKLHQQGQELQLAPLTNEIFRAFELTPLPQVRVVIIGQDPYPQQLPNGLPRAMGLSFSVRVGDQIPVSLRNIFAAIKHDFSFFQSPSTGDLTCWAQQGVLMLNTSLTVRIGFPTFFQKIWMGFLTRVIEIILRNRPIFVLWGREARDNLLPLVEGQTPYLTAPHPSARGEAGKAFISCGHFLAINQRLVGMGQEPINWQVP